MRQLFITLQVVARCIALAEPIGVAEARQVKSQVHVRFELDGACEPPPQMIEVRRIAGDAIVSARVTHETFEVPDYAMVDDWLSVHFSFAGRSIEFPVHKDRFHGLWTIGIDLPPFSPERAAMFEEGEEEPLELWYIVFSAEGKESTAATILIR